MVAKRAVRKQQDTSRTQERRRSAAVADPASAHRVPGDSGLADAFNAAVAQAAEDADPTAVHRVRTGSRRLQATLEATLREGGPAADGLERPARAWLRELKQIRRAAGAVRDLDVQRKILEQWVGQQAPAQDAVGQREASPPEMQAEMKQAEQLDAWLKGERKHLAHGMQKQIRKRQQRLAKGQNEFFSAMTRVPLARAKAPRSADAVALEDFVRATDAMPLLHTENLHDFRKATKKARYVAEAGAEGQNNRVWPRRCSECRMQSANGTTGYAWEKKPRRPWGRMRRN